MLPIRIQRKRTKGWKMPENTVSVTRPGKWGNPFVVGEEAPSILDEMYSKFTWQTMPEYLDGNDYLSYGVRGHEIPDSQTAVRLFKQMLDWMNDKKRPQLHRDFISPLKGKNLACFCKEGDPCHADVLLELANQ